MVFILCNCGQEDLIFINICSSRFRSHKGLGHYLLASVMEIMVPMIGPVAKMFFYTQIHI